MSNYQFKYPPKIFKPLTRNDYMEFVFVPTEIPDGDTLKGNFDKGHGEWLMDVSLRIRGIDCAEVKSTNPQLKRLGELAREFVKTIIPIGERIIVHSFYAEKLSIENKAIENPHLATKQIKNYRLKVEDYQQLLEKEKFGRFPIDILITPITFGSITYLSTMLLGNHLAVPYPKPINRKLLIPQHIENYKKVFND